MDIHDVSEASEDLRRAHIRMTTDAMLAESKHNAAAYEEELSATDAAVSQAIWRQQQFGAEAWEHETSRRAEERREEERRLRHLVDPHFERDAKRGMAKEACHRPNMKASPLSGLLFAPAPPVPGYDYPQHTSPLPRHVGIHQIAKFSGEVRWPQCVQP